MGGAGLEVRCQVLQDWREGRGVRARGEGDVVDGCGRGDGEALGEVEDVAEGCSTVS